MSENTNLNNVLKDFFFCIDIFELDFKFYYNSRTSHIFHVEKPKMDNDVEN